MAWNDKIDDMTNNKATAEVRADNLPPGYVVKKEPRTNHRSFALQKSVLDELKKIAEEKGTNLNALVNEIFIEYVTNYRKGE